MIDYNPRKYRAFDHAADQYAKAVLGGDILACRWVRLACLRHLDDQLRDDLIFDEDMADRALSFFAELRLWKGREYKGKPFTLAPHFKFITSCIMGWYRLDGTRRFRTAYVEMARKGAKSTFAGGLGAYFFIVDGEDGAEVYAAAVKKDQAKIVWSNVKNLTQKSIFSNLVTYYRHNLSVESTLSKCEPLSSDTRSMDGYDTHFASLDELHAHPTAEIHDLVADSTGARLQPMILIITTAGFDQSGICYERREYLTKILKGIISDDSFFGMIYTLDTARDWPELKKETQDDWQNEDAWIKAMPGLCGITQSGQRFGVDKKGRPIPGYMTKLQDVREKARYAAASPAAQNNFLTKRLNIWTQQAERWISLETWDANHTRPVIEDDLHGRRCVGGIDLSAVSDLTIWTMLFPDADERDLVDILLRCWCPEAKLHDTKNKYREQYQSWHKTGFLEVTDGDAMDYDYIRARIRDDAKVFNIDSIGVDRLFQGYEFSMKLNDELGGTEKAPKVVACGMGYLSMAGPMNEFERRLLGRKLNHGGNPVLRFMADSVAISVDPAGNMKPNKAKSQGRIDGIIGILLGLDRLMREAAPRRIMMPATI